MDVERLQRDGGFQFAQEEPPLGVLGFDLRLEAPRPAAAFPLGGAQRQAGTTHQFLAGRAVLRRLRDTDAGGDLPHPVDEDRTQQRTAQRFGEHRRGAPVVAADDDGELVVLEAAEQRARRQSGVQPFGDIQQHGVAAGPSQRVVDLAKAVEIDQREDHDAGAAPGQRIVEALEHHAVIGQAGQFVLTRQLAHRLGAAFERTQQRLQAAHGENGAQCERGADRRQQRPQPIHRAKVRAVGHPTEPADDAAARIVQRLQLAAGIRR